MAVIPVSETHTSDETRIESYNSHLAHSVRNFFPPSWLEILIYFMVSAIVLCLLNYHVFTNNIGLNSGVSQGELNSYLHSNFAHSTDFISKLLQGRAGSLVFWAFLGSIIYMIVWVIQNLVINIENDVQASDFVGIKGHEAKKQAYWHSVMSSKIFFVCASLAAITYAIGLFSFFLPVASRTFGLAIANFQSVKSTLSIVLVLIITTFLFYLFIFSMKVVARAWQWIIGNF